MLDALVFSLLLLAPQQTPDPIQCVVVNIAPEPRLVCGCDLWTEKSGTVHITDKLELVIPSSEWPEAWYPAHLTGIYNAEIREGQLYAVETKETEGQSEAIRARSLAEQRRWRRHALQQKGIQK